MPEICRFLGIIISMYYREHGPPHFHAKYDDYRASFSILELNVLEGDMPRRVVTLILEWAFKHREELLEDWNFAQEKQELKKITPLV
ncbi:MAG: DUF4160 domain-containing protein [bacterium]|nr:DUF4160 domain-containing protein [bacterium]